MLNAKAAAEREGWTHCPTSGRAGKWQQYLAHECIFLARLFAINPTTTYLLTLILIIYKAIQSNDQFYNLMLMRIRQSEK